MAAKYGIQVLDEGGSIVQGSPSVVTVQLLDLTGALITDAPTGGTWEPVSGATVSGVLSAPSGDVTQTLSFVPLSTPGFYQAAFQVANNAETGTWFLKTSMVNGADVAAFPNRPIYRVVTQ